ncbi:MAG: hypothetical protein HWD60_15555 [Defluviicoccus sp.]|nr:MAG: hypothetical protein HWD60_15555 [Defluviicoccus sp.]
MVSAAWLAMMTGDYDSVLALQPVFERGGAPALAEPLAGALAATARSRADQAKSAPDGDRTGLLRQAKDLAQRAEKSVPESRPISRIPTCERP